MNEQIRYDVQLAVLGYRPSARPVTDLATLALLDQLPAQPVEPRSVFKIDRYYDVEVQS